MTYDTSRWESLARYLAGEGSSDEQAKVREWLAGDPARAELLAALERALRRAAVPPPADLGVEGALRAVTARRVRPLRPNVQQRPAQRDTQRGAPVRPDGAVPRPRADGPR